LFKQNKISAADLKVATQQLGDRVKASNIDWTKQVALMTSLHHVNERAEVGFKSMSRTLKEMYAEERVQNRTLSEMKQTMQSLSSVIGGEAGKQAGTLIGNFQGLEFALQASSRALGQAGGKLGMVGAALGNAAMPIAIIGSGFLSLAANAEEARAKTSGFLNKLRELRGEQLRMQEEKVAALKARGIKGTMGGAIRGNLVGMTPSQYALYGEQVADADPELMYEEELLRQMRKSGAETKATKDKSAAEAARDARINALTSGIASRNRGRADARVGNEYDLARSIYGAHFAKPDMAPGAAFMGRAKETAAPDTAGGIKVAEKEFSAFQQSFMSGVGAMGATLSQTVGGAFAAVFGGAHTLLGSFASAFAATMAELAANWVIGKLIGATVGLVTGGGPIGAILGATGGTTLADTRGVGPGGAGGGTGGVLTEIRNAIQSMELRVDNVGIYMASQRGRVAYADR
jgi:hypothetical protein